MFAGNSVAGMPSEKARSKRPDESPSASAPIAAYLHVPFCRRRCFYCDFPISVLGDRPTSGTDRAIASYTDALCREIAATPRLNSEPLQTVFFGGGTPSLLSPELLARLLAALGDRFGIATGAELSIEMDPGTFDRDRARGYRAAGITRVSLGVQAFQDELLELCGRSHRVADVRAAVDLLRAAGFDNLSFDLISALPHQTLAQWEASLQQAIALAPEHLSCYDLIVEPKTAFARRYEPGCDPLPDDETAAHMYRLTRSLLTAAGYEHYEIGNYARPGRQCRHNRIYWANGSYYGFGMGAASSLQRRRFTRPRTREQYYAWLDAYAVAGRIAADESEAIDELLETLMLGLRLVEGVDLARLDRFGAQTRSQVWSCLRRYARVGWVEVAAPDGTLLGDVADLPAAGRLRLSDPEGLLCSNTVLAALFEAIEV